jgi:hypothetical protein
MNTILTSLTIFASIFGAALLGMAIRRKVPDNHLGSDAKDVIRLVTGITATTSALVLGMLVSNAKTYYDSWNAQVAEIASQVVTIDRLMADYGPETDEIRVEFRQLVQNFVERTWPKQDSLQVALKPQYNGDILMRQVELLTPKDALQTSEKSQIVPMITSLRQAQWRMFARSQQTTMPTPLLVIVVSWQAVIFVSMALFAPRNITIFVTFALGALTISTAVLLILDMYSPFKGILTISSAPITDSLTEMRH